MSQATTGSSSSPASSKPGSEEYRSSDGRSFGQLSLQEQDLLINGPRISIGLVALAVLLWAGFLTFLVVLVSPYIIR